MAERPSSGCGKSPGYPTGSSTSQKFSFKDPKLGTVARQFSLKIPKTAKISTPLPLFVMMHGQYGKAVSESRNYQYDTLADKYGFQTLYPQGLSEDGGCGTGWNTGMQGSSSTCSASQARPSCCYKSCRTLGLCTNSNTKCGWASCYDDVQFVSDLIDHVGASSCVDLDAVFISGQSNGGMIMWDFIKKIPTKFAAVLPIYGSPLVGFGQIPSAAANLPMLYLTGRSDRVIPPQGGNGGGWYYVSAKDAVAAVAKVHKCSSSSTSSATPYDGGRHKLACVEHLKCGSGKRVMLCEYDGGHSFAKTLQAEELGWWFASQFITTAANSTNSTL